MKAWVRHRMETIVLAVGITELAIGLWMAISPATFFDTVGGFGAEATTCGPPGKSHGAGAIHNSFASVVFPAPF